MLLSIIRAKRRLGGDVCILNGVGEKPLQAYVGKLFILLHGIWEVLNRVHARNLFESATDRNV